MPGRMLKEIWAKYGEWTSLSDLEQPGVIVQLLLARNGVKLHLHENGEVYITVGQ